MPEKSLNQIPAAQRELFDKGMAALQKSNLDYAVALFTQVLKAEPGFFDCRQALRVAQQKRAGSKTSFFKKFVGSASTLTKGQIALRSNPYEAINVAEDILNEDPTNSDAHELLASAALDANLPKTAVLSLEVAFKAHPKNRKLAEKLADTLTSLGQNQRAERIFRDLLTVYPNDPDIGEKLKNTLASRTLAEGGYEALADGSGSYRDILRNKEEAKSLEQQNRTVKDADVAGRLIHELETALQSEPTNVRSLLQIAELHLGRGEFDRTLEYQQRAIDAGGVNDPTIIKAMLDTRIAQFEHLLQNLDKTAPDYEAQAAELRKKKATFLLEDTKRRVDLYPSDLQLRFELGDLYFQNGRIGEAIAELQKAQNNPNRRIPAMSLLAQCFAKRGMNDLAAKKIAEAIKEKPVFDEEKKDLHYQLGSIFEKLARKDEAIEQFKIIYEQDIGYRDVMTKVDEYYATQG
jgi:tetratricopeptide (TPR) repeat protein